MAKLPHVSVNRRNITRLIKFLEELPEEQFDMNNWVTDYIPANGKPYVQHTCNTVACIGGWINFLGKSHDAKSELFARNYLNINHEAALELFFLSNWDMYYSDITKQHAIACLRHLHATGEVDWSVANPKFRHI